MHGYRPEPHRLAGGEGGIEAVEDPHHLCALALAVQIQGHGRAITPLELAAPARGRSGFQGRGYNLGGHEVAGFKQQAELVESHNKVLPRRIWNLSRQG